MGAARKGFVEVDGRLVHFREAGSGPAVVLLHDSPRSSRLHGETMRTLADRFHLVALDTPGYGNSEPLQGPEQTIPALAHALARTLEVIGLAGVPLYATHTSAKIAIDYAAFLHAPPRLILDGLALPSGPPDRDFIDRYMRPFRLDDGGGYLASEWTRVRDMLRWFPWFQREAEARMAMPMPSAPWINDYVVDFLSAGPNYASAYAAAMRYDPGPALCAVRCPTVIGARASDVLSRYLDRIPVGLNPSLSVARLSDDRTAWIEWLAVAFAGSDVTPGQGRESPDARSRYVDLPHGQLLVHRTGREAAPKRPLLILQTPTLPHARRWQRAIADRPTLVPELPGHGESDAMAHASPDAVANALAAMLDALGIGQVDVLAIGFAGPSAAALASRSPKRVVRVVFDGCYLAGSDGRPNLGARLCPAFDFDAAGGHLHRIWHMLRDAEVQWPWFDGGVAAHRPLEPVLAAQELHPALLAILKQPTAYGNIVRAVCDIPPAQRYAPFVQPALLLERPDDPAYAGVPAVAALLPHGRLAPRAAGIAATAPTVLAFLSEAPPPA